MTSFHRSRGPLWGAPEIAIAAMALQGKEGSGCRVRCEAKFKRFFELQVANGTPAQEQSADLEFSV